MTALRLGRLFGDRGGGAAVQFAFALPILITLLLGGMEFGRLFWTWTTIQYAAEETGRYAMGKPSATASELTTYLRGKLPGMDASTIDVVITPETVGGVNYMNIVAQFHFSFLSLFPIAPVDLQGRSRVPVVS